MEREEAEALDLPGGESHPFYRLLRDIADRVSALEASGEKIEEIQNSLSELMRVVAGDEHFGEKGLFGRMSSIEQDFEKYKGEVTDRFHKAEKAALKRHMDVNVKLAGVAMGGSVGGGIIGYLAQFLG